MTELVIHLDAIDPVDLLGINNSRLQLLRNAFPRVKFASRGNKLRIEGSSQDLELLESKINQMVQFIEKYGRLSDKTVEDLLADVDPFGVEVPDATDVITYGPGGAIIKARTAGQKQMVALAENNDVVFAIGPAGTGKTYTAVALAVRALKNKEVRKIILTRPAVEAGENLGYLPGDLKEKIDPYLRPLYDALDDMIPIEKLNYYMSNRIIEVAPLAFMRGRTLDHAYIILDEAQNTTEPQLKMFLTRIGPSAKCIITGDITQVDLPRHQRSGLIKALTILQGVEGIAAVHLSERDVVRHPLVKQIIRAYEEADKKDRENQPSGEPNP
ncbi:MAG: PhoH family protein [Chitinophagales bacterium]|nr:PhoH family protein [Chitinophagales bacterium]MDW8392776.1 PhoH family protein [Chitinophagales bacterium]